ncbi:MAG: zeta toxin family protein [Dyadobacter sp.]|uniref:zeta toxin family protein n=1 Tax=Dyadobacter sp. TaxID=1914288 RepID=UPI001B032583|nr:zeta toxin family protein [Dyadobacter sp.]MBO9613438.1 zeta toxin family protein [Dyadobacter sp.]
MSNSSYLKGRRLRVFAGPNGSGKTTIFRQIAEKFDIGYYVNADDLEVQLINTKKIELTPFGLTDLQEYEFAHFQNNHSILQTARQSGFELNLTYSGADNSIIDSNTQGRTYSYEAALIADFLRIKLIERGKKLTFETVMSHPSKLDMLQYAIRNGYKVYLYFVCTQSADINVARVLQRVGQGGHDVLEEKIRKRYKASLQLLKPAVKTTFRAFVWDNSQQSPELILEVESGQTVTQISETLPNWVEEFLLK